MFVYWIMFYLAAGSVALYGSAAPYKQKSLLFLLILFYIFIIGFRYEIGCDWNSYMAHFESALINEDWSKWSEISGDISYSYLNLFISAISDKILLVNLFCSFLACFGLYKFCSVQASPLLAILVAVPYILIVFFQGYTRQSVAFGLELWALAALLQSKNFKFVILVFIGTTFHKTALILLPLVALAGSKNRWLIYFWIFCIASIALSTILVESQNLWKYYVEQNMSSGGGGIRIALNAIPSMIFLTFKNKFEFKNESESKLWFWFSIFSLACIPLALMSTTAADRIALYFMPIQLFVYSSLPYIFPKFKQIIIFSIVCFYALILVIWLNFANHAVCWVPYNNWFLI